MKHSLSEALKSLRLSGLAQSLDVRLMEAKGNSLSHEEFLELIVQDEMHVRHERLIARRLKASCFRELKSLEDFDWRFNRSIKRRQIYDLAAGHFIGQRRDVLFVGPPGSASPTSARPSATRPSSWAAASSTGPSSTWSGTSCATRPWAARNASCPAISSLTC